MTINTHTHTPSSLTAADTSGSSTSFDSLPALEAYILDRQDADFLCHGRLQTLQDHCQQYARDKCKVDGQPFCPPAYGAVVKIQDIEPLTRFEPSSRRALVVFVPDSFDAVLLSMAKCSPDTFNYPDLGLRRNTMYQAWSAVDPLTQQLLALWVFEYALLEAGSDRDASIEPFVLPVIFVTTRRVAVGGFWVTDAYQAGCQGTWIASDHHPADRVSPQQLADAREQETQHGSLPWVFQPWTTQLVGSAQCQTLAAVVCQFDCPSE